VTADERDDAVRQLRRAYQDSTFDPLDPADIHARHAAFREGRRTRLAAAGVAAVMLIAVGVGVGSQLSRRSVSERDFAAGHLDGITVKALPTKPYELTLGGGSCRGGALNDKLICWAPEDGTPVAMDAVAPKNVQLRLSAGDSAAYTAVESSMNDTGSVARRVAIGGDPGVLDTDGPVVKLTWKTSPTGSLSVEALGIAENDVLAFAASVYDERSVNP
jgi:hypothetical protein